MTKKLPHQRRVVELLRDTAKDILTGFVELDAVAVVEDDEGLLTLALRLRPLNLATWLDHAQHQLETTNDV
jgi:hypothetical protein